ncbi:hypothetical protein ACHAQJ_001057 [Trichoderma viride]
MAEWDYTTFVVFNYLNVFDNLTCSDYANPDIAGLGVVLSFVISAFVATAASIAIAILDDDHSTDILPRRLRAWISMFAKPKSKKANQFWRTFLERLILTLADQQLVTGISLPISLYISMSSSLEDLSVVLSFRNAYSALVVYLMLLSSSTHIAMMIVLKHSIKRHRVITNVRITLIILFAGILLWTVCMSVDFTFLPFYIPLKQLLFRGLISLNTYDVLRRLIPGVIMAYVFWVCIINLIPFRKAFASKFRGKTLNKGWRGRLYSVASFCLFSTPFTVFIIQIVVAIISLVFCLGQKFSKAPPIESSDFISEYCGLNEGENNQWGFGQVTAMILLATPVLFSVETYFGQFATTLEFMKKL